MANKVLSFVEARKKRENKHSDDASLRSPEEAQKEDNTEESAAGMEAIIESMKKNEENKKRLQSERSRHNKGVIRSNRLR